MTGGRIVVRALEDEGIPFTFGIPGTHNIELYDALAESDRVEAVLVTDEQSASFMADGVWRASGRMACANVVPGAGLTHAMSGIAEAFMDNVPMLVLGCGIRRDTSMAYQLHDVDQRSMVEPVTKGTFLPTRGDEIYPVIRSACRLARTGAPGPVFVEIPANLYMFRHEVELPERPEVPERAKESGGSEARWTQPGAGSDAGVVERSSGRGSGVRARGWAGLPGDTAPVSAADLDRVVELVREARRPLLYVGAGAAAAQAEVVALAERLEAPVSTTFQGKGVMPETHPLFLWPGFGDAAPTFAREVAARCDLTLAVGCRFSEVGTGSYGLEPPGPLVHVDIDPEVPGRNYPAEVTLVADAGDFLGKLLLRLEEEDIRREGDGLLRDEIREGHLEVWDDGSAAATDGVSPSFLIRIGQELLGPESVFTTDSGNGTFLAMECLRLDRPGRFLAPVDYSCMGYSVPAAIGAKLARPDAPVVALAGDGAFLMTGLEMITAAELGVGVIVLVLRDRELAQIAQFQDTALNRKANSRVADYDLEGFARGLGVDFLTLESDDEVETTLERAAGLAERGRPVLVEVAIDYSRKTYFTRGVVKTNLLRLPLKDRVRFLGRALLRRVTE